MPDPLESATSGRNWIEKIADRIPGFSGYQNRETRREVDRVWRGHLAAKIDDLRARVADRIRTASRGGNLDAVGGWDSVDKRLDELANRVRTTDYGYSGFFDAIKIREPELDQIYRFDLGFDDEVGALATRAAEAGADELLAAVDAALGRWKSRAELVHLAAKGGA